MADRLRKVGKARFSAFLNDLYWEYCGYTDEYVWLDLKWFGYNDAYWWDKVAPTDMARTIEGQDGHMYRIDFHTNDVCEVI